MRLYMLILCVLAGLALQSCAVYPEAELNEFAARFENARTVSGGVIGELETDLEQQRVYLEKHQNSAQKLLESLDPGQIPADQILKPASVYPAYDPSPINRIDRAEIVAVRKEVWVVLDSYVKVLKALSMGQDVLSVSLNQLTDAASGAASKIAGSIYPGAGLIVEALAGLIKQINKLIALERFRDAVEAADGIVGALVELMIEDTKSIYAIKKSVDMYKTFEKAEEFDELGPLTDLAMVRHSLSGDADIDREFTTQFTELVAILKTMPLTRHTGALRDLADRWEALRAPIGEKTADGKDRSKIGPTELKAMIDARKVAKTWRDDEVIRFNAITKFKEALEAYVSALRTMRAVHALLLASSDSGIAFDFNQALQVFRDAKSAWDKFKAASPKKK